MAITGNDLRKMIEEEKKKKDDSSEKITGEQLRELSKTYKHYDTLDTSGVDDKYINSFSSDISSFFDAYQSDKLSYTDANTRLGDFNTRYDTIQAWLYKNKNYLQEDSYKGLSDSLNSVKTGLDAIKGHYSQWGSEDEYNRYVSNRDYDLDAGLTELEGLMSQVTEYTALKSELQSIYDTAYKSLDANGFTKDKDKAQMLEQMLPNFPRYQEIQNILATKYADFNLLDATNTLHGKDQAYKEAKTFQETQALLYPERGEEFDQYVQAGKEVDNPTWNESLPPVDIFGIKPQGEGEEVNNWLTFFEESYNDKDNPQKNINPLQSLSGKGSSEIRERIDLMLATSQMSEDEQAIYHYYVGKGDTENAEKYLDYMVERYKQDTAQGIADKVDGNLVLEPLFSAAAGLGQFVTGVGNLDNYIMGTEADPTTTMQYAYGITSSNNKGVWRALNDLSNTTAHMLPTILVSAITEAAIPTTGEGVALGAVIGGALGSVTLGASATGNAYAEMRNLGYDANQARLYATLVGASEAGLQYLMGGISKLGGVAPGGLTELVLSKVDNAFARVAIQLGSSMFSEGLEEGIQTILEPWFKSIVTGVDFEAPGIDEILYSGLLGALSAGLLDGIEIGGGTLGTTIQGKSLMKNGVTAKSLSEYITKNDTLFSADTVAYRLAGKVNEKTGAYTIARLFNEANAILTEQNQNDIIDALEAHGIATKDAKTIATAMALAVSGAKLTPQQQAALDNNPVISRVTIDTLVNAHTTVNQRMQGFKKAMFGEKIAKDVTEKLSTESTIANLTSEAETTAETANVSDSGKTLYNGNEVSINRVVSTDGGIKVELDSGETVNVSDLSFATKEEALMYEMVARMETTPETANEILKTFKPTDIKQASAYYSSVPLAYTYGKINYEAGLKNVASVLSKEQKKIIYNRGRADAITSVKSKSASKKGGTSKKNGIIYENGFTYDESKATEIQKVSMAYIDVISKMSNLDIHVFESTKKNGKRVATVNGKEVSAPNGYFKNGNQIYIDINAGNNAEGVMLITMAHEITHYIREWNAEGFKELADFLIAEYGKQGVPVNYLLEAQKEKIKKRYEEENKALPGEAKLADMAYEEMVADAMGEMLTDPKAYEKLAKLKQQNKTLWQKVGEAIKAILDKFKTALGIYKNRRAQTNEADFVRDFAPDVYEKLQDLYLKAFVEADANYEASIGKATEGVNGETKYSYSSMAYTFFGDQDITIKDFENGSYKETEGYKRYVDQCLNNMKQTVEGFSEKAALKEITDSIDGIVKVAVAMKKSGYDIFDNHAKRTTRDSKNRLLFSSLEPNSDYFTSSDISTICDKRINFAEIYDEIVRRESELGVPKGKRFFDNVDNYFILHKIMADKGLTQPCRQCYVESMRKNLAPMANAFLKLMQETNPNNKSNDQLFHTTGKNKGSSKTNNAKLRENLLEAIETEKYDITASDLTVEMLTTDKGLARLKLQAPLIYEAFNSFYGQSKPKMPKSATPFRFGELTALLTDEKGRVKKSLIKKILSTGGFRLQSYSDFQIQNFADVLQVIFEAGTLGLSGHAYTKVPAFLDATKGTNLKRNISIFMYNDGGEWKIDKNDSFPYDLDKIYDIVNSDKSGNTSIIAVVQNEDMASWIMANDNILYFIPFHKSGMKMGTVRETIVKEDGRQIKGYSGIKDHTRQQTEVWASTTSDHKANTKVKEGINIYEFWDFDNVDNLSKKELIEKNVKAYIDACNEAGYLPKFREYVMNNSKVLNSVLAYSKQLGFVSQDATIDDISFKYKGYTIPYGYFKCLGDFGMFTPDGKASPIERLSLKNYNFAEAEAFFSDAETLRRNEILQQISNGAEREKYRNSGMTTAEIAEEVQSKRNEVVEEVVSGEYKKTKYSERDSEGNTLSKEQIEFFKDSKVRDKNGNLMVMYHGTTANFNTFKKGDVGFHFGTKGAARGRVGFGKNVTLKEVYLNITNPIVFNEDLGSWDADYELTKKLFSMNVLTRAEAESVLFTDNKLYRRSTEEANKKLSALLQSKGYDGIAYKNTHEGKKDSTSYIVFNSNQAKEITNKAPTSDPDMRYSTRDSYAPTFYSHMGKVVDGIRIDKMGANGVVSYLKGKGVKDEEIKWSGIEAFLEGKKSVTKKELQEFVAGSMLRIEETNSGINNEAYTELDKLWQENFLSPLEDVFDPEDFDETTVSAQLAFLEENGMEMPSEDIQQRMIVLAHKIGKPTRWEQYKLDGGTNYRELVFKMPDSTYTNRAMGGHWGQDAEGILVHTRVQDFIVNGKKMLFIEELQSDWHNEGLQKGYTTKEYEDALAVYDKLAEDYAKKRKAFNQYVRSSEFRSDPDEVGKKKFDWLRSKMDTAEKRMQDAERDIESLKAKGMGDVADAPFRSTYHEYVLKRLLRMAAEEGYDTIGWTPADIQSDRWSEDYAEAYRIEYDQDMPKFLRKYGKKWGATVGKSTIYDTEVWSMDITDSMKDSVLHEGQVMYSRRDNSPNTFNPKGMTLKQQLQDALTTSHSNERRYVYVGEFTQEFIDKLKKHIDIKKYPIVMNYRDAYLSMEAKENGKYQGERINYHNLGVDGLESALMSFSDPEYVLLSTKEGKIELILQGRDYKNRQLFSIVEVNTTAQSNKKYIDVHVVTSVYGNRGLHNRIATATNEGRVIYKKEEESTQGMPQVQYKRDINANSSANRISQDSESVKSEMKNSLRDNNSFSNRSLLANALESVVQNDIEKNKLNQYKEKIALIESAQAKLSEIKAKANELRFTKGRSATETKQMRELDAEATRIANRINTYDKQLLDLESTTALKGVLAREKELIRKRMKQNEKQAVKRQMEKDAETIRTLMQKHTESRAKAVEGRHKTELRHKIKNVVADLNKLLLNPTKEQHVPIGLQLVVSEALDAINMDTMNAGERVAYYNDLIAKSSDPDEIAMLTRKRDFFEYREANFKERITALKNAYADIKNDPDPLVQNAHHQDIEDLIENTADAVKDTSLKDMSYEQLEAVHNMYKAVLATVRKANQTFFDNIKETIAENGEAVKSEVKEVGGHKDRVLKIFKFIKKFGWNMLKPVTAMKVIGSKTFEKLFGNVRAGEDTWATDVNEAKAFYNEISKKYGYKKWDFKKRYTFKDSAGQDISLSLEQIMSLYAYSKRDQADKHLDVGGFVFDDSIEVVEKKFGIPLKYDVNDANPYRLKKADLLPIIDSLTEEQKGFVDEMQTYLSEVMGAKGNEVSLAMYDIKLYNEKNYFPLKTARYFREFDPEKGGTPKIKNSGFSKKTMPHAGNPIILSNFMDVWASHVNDMSMYHAFVLPLEDFMRVFNYKTTAGGYDSVQQYIKNAYGAQANQYIERLMDDLNGGARVDSSADVINKGISLFKKASVFASASVVIQQPSAIARAFAYINPKYFVTSAGSALNLVKHKSVWEEIKKYAPVAVIKEMGYFDTGMGKSTVEWIKGNKTIKDKVDDALAKAPAMADELSWSYIWLAVKNEIKATTNLKVGSEEFLKKAGERFTEIITNTQVYDSVLSRSGMMRSKDTGMKMATAFMAEPTTTVNMMVDGFMQGKRGNKKFAASTVGAVSASIILNSILVSLVYAARDDDEDETYAEKYIGSLTTELIDGFNPLTYIPFVKDIWSIAQGYDVERSDMSVISNLWETIEGLFSDKKKGWEKVADVVGAVSSLFGLPLKNILRDAKGLYNLFATITSGTPTTGAGIGDSIGDAFRNSVPLLGRFYEDETKSDKLYDAIISGDSNQIDRIKGQYKSDKDFESAMRAGLRANDSRIHEAAQARLDGDLAKYTRIAKEIIAEGHFSQDTVVGAINAEMSAIKKGESVAEEPAEEKDEATSIYSGSDINSAFENGDASTALSIINDLIATKVANGMDEKSAKSSLRSSMTSYWKPLYKEAYQSGNTSEMARIRRILYSSGLYGTANDVVKTAQNWLRD